MIPTSIYDERSLCISAGASLVLILWRTKPSKEWKLLKNTVRNVNPAFFRLNLSLEHLPDPSGVERLLNRLDQSIELVVQLLRVIDVVLVIVTGLILRKLNPAVFV